VFLVRQPRFTSTRPSHSRIFPNLFHEVVSKSLTHTGGGGGGGLRGVPLGDGPILVDEIEVDRNRWIDLGVARNPDGTLTDRFRAHEADTAIRTERLLGVELEPFVRDRHPGAGDFVVTTESGIIVYEMLSAVSHQGFRIKKFLESVNDHLLRTGNDHIVIDITSLADDQRRVVEEFVNNGDYRNRDKIIWIPPIS
jgi:hypothetical protein